MSSPVHLVNLDTDEALPDITEAEFEFLNEHLEQESEDDDDYYVDQATIEMLADAGAPAHLIAVLRQAIGESKGVEIRWEKVGTET